MLGSIHSRPVNVFDAYVPGARAKQRVYATVKKGDPGAKAAIPLRYLRSGDPERWVDPHSWEWSCTSTSSANGFDTALLVECFGLSWRGGSDSQFDSHEGGCGRISRTLEEYARSRIIRKNRLRTWADGIPSTSHVGNAGSTPAGITKQNQGFLVIPQPG